MTRMQRRLVERTASCQVYIYSLRVITAGMTHGVCAVSTLWRCCDQLWYHVIRRVSLSVSRRCRLTSVTVLMDTTASTVTSRVMAWLQATTDLLSSSSSLSQWKIFTLYGCGHGRPTCVVPWTKTFLLVTDTNMPFASKCGTCQHRYALQASVDVHLFDRCCCASNILFWGYVYKFSYLLTANALYSKNIAFFLGNKTAASLFQVSVKAVDFVSWKLFTFRELSAPGCLWKRMND